MSRTQIFRAAGVLTAAGVVAAAVFVLLPSRAHTSHRAAVAGAARLASAAAADNPVPPPADPGTLSPATAAGLNLAPRSVQQRGRFTAASGKSFGVYVGTRSDNGRQCIMLVGGGSTAGGCNPTLFSNGPVDFVEAFSGGPARSERTDFEIAGVVADNVERLDVIDSLNRVTRIDTSGENKAFFYEVKPADLARGVGVNTLVARDDAGTAIASFDVSEPG
jgi:hypothetical protein